MIGLWCNGSTTGFGSWGVYMNKVFDDKTLNYDRKCKFNVKETYNCKNQNTGDQKVEENAVEGIFE